MHVPRFFIVLLLAAPFWTATAHAGEFATPGGALPANIDDAMQALRQPAYDIELLISYGTSKGGSAGHLALAIRDEARAADDADDAEHVYSANFYADRTAKHALGFYTDALMLRIPKQEYLFGTRSSLGENAAFGLDFGEVYKRSLVGIRVSGVPAQEKKALAAYFARINADYRAGAKDTEYHAGEVKYDYMQLNCAKTIGAAFRYGAAYTQLDVSHAKLFKHRRVAIAAQANIPTEMAVKLMHAWQARGYTMEAVLYRKYPESNWMEPHEEDTVRFRDLPDRFPSVLSRDFRREQGEYKDYDNLYVMYLLYNLGRYSVRIDTETRLLEVATLAAPMAFADAAARAESDARADSAGFLRRAPFRPKGARLGEPSALPP